MSDAKPRNAMEIAERMRLLSLAMKIIGNNTTLKLVAMEEIEADPSLLECKEVKQAVEDARGDVDPEVREKAAGLLQAPGAAPVA